MISYGICLYVSSISLEVKLLSCVQLFVTPWTVVRQAPSVHGVSQAKILVWVAISFSRGSSQPRDQTCISCIGRQVLYHWATREAHLPLLVTVLMAPWYPNDRLLEVKGSQHVLLKQPTLLKQVTNQQFQACGSVAKPHKHGLIARRPSLNYNLLVREGSRRARWHSRGPAFKQKC